MDKASDFFSTQLLFQFPVLLVSFGGVILSITFWSRAPGPCLLALIASGLLLIGAVSLSLIQGNAYHAYLVRRWELAQYSLVLRETAIAESIIRALAIGLLLGAVVSGRSAAR